MTLIELIFAKRRVYFMFSENQLLMLRKGAAHLNICSR
jgi:hypothetical protein